MKLGSGEELKAHTLVWGAGLQGNKLVQSLGIEPSAATASASGPTSPSPGHPEVYAVGDVAAILDPKSGRCCPNSGRSRCSRAKHAGETIARRIAGKKTKPFAYLDKGTMATIGRGAAVVSSSAGERSRASKPNSRRGAVHLALLPTNEDRAKAVVDWAGAAFTHQRAGRITVEDE